MQKSISISAVYCRNLVHISYNLKFGMQLKHKYTNFFSCCLLLVYGNKSVLCYLTNIIVNSNAFYFIFLPKFLWISDITITLSTKSYNFISSYHISIPFILFLFFYSTCQDLGAMWNRGSYITHQFTSFYLRGNSFNSSIYRMFALVLFFLVDILY